MNKALIFIQVVFCLLLLVWLATLINFGINCDGRLVLGVGRFHCLAESPCEHQNN